MDMIEQVARGIAFAEGMRIVRPGQSMAAWRCEWKEDGSHFKQFVEDYWKDFTETARHAIQAMREPTDEMDRRGNVCCMDDCVDRDGVKKVWRSMIDGALGQSEDKK